MNAKANLAYTTPSNVKVPYMFLNVILVEISFLEQGPR